MLRSRFLNFHTPILLWGNAIFPYIDHVIENKFTNSVTTHSWFHRTDQGTELVENFFEFFVLQIFGPWLALRS